MTDGQSSFDWLGRLERISAERWAGLPPEATLFEAVALLQGDEHMDVMDLALSRTTVGDFVRWLQEEKARAKAT